MAEKVQSDNVREIDPNFPIPEGLSIFSYAQPAEGDLFELENFFSTADFAEVGEVSVEDSEVPTNTDDAPTTPQIFGIASQTIRTAPDGSQVVDVVLDVEDIDGLSKYDIRIAAI